jgi:hypothetical protein
MVSGFIGNEVPRKGLRVRFPCPPLPPPWDEVATETPQSDEPLDLRRFLFEVLLSQQSGQLTNRRLEV